MSDRMPMTKPVAIFSDIHANLPALTAVLADMEGQGITERLCLGDIVGYGASPAACVERLRTEGIPSLKGNHDAAVTHGFEAAGVMKRVWDWTEEQLGADQLKWLEELPLVFEQPGFQAVHAMLPAPENWNYVLNASDADLHFVFQTRPVCFIGHTHLPAFWLEDEDGSLDTEITQKVFPERKQLVNVGSVGQPRDGDHRACYLIYDEAAGEVRWRRVSYDIASAQNAIEDAGLPLFFAERLAMGK
jgi:diadenosine tetraphosphatase ApaH/serine/threonine PP2A family protein phosphatase